MAGSRLKCEAPRIAAFIATFAIGCSPREADRVLEASVEVSEHLLSDADMFEKEQRIVAGAVTDMLAETPRRAIGVMLIDPHGPRFHTFGPRSLDGSPFDPDTTFEIGSVSKVFAGVLLAEAERRGEVDLDDPVAAYLPDWALPARDGHVMTLRHTATHTTGLPLMPANWVKTEGGRTRYTEPMFRDNLGSHVLESSPGERYVYSNLNTALIGLALTRRTGRVYSALLQERVFDPLGMRRSGYPDVRQRIDDNSLDGYEEDESLSIPRIDVSPMGPCCVVRSSLRDMGRFAAAALGSDGPLTAAFARSVTPQRPMDPSDFDSRWIGLGWEIDRRLGLVRKSGQVAGYRCELVLQPQAGRGLFVLVNSMRAKILELSDELIGALWDPRRSARERSRTRFRSGRSHHLGLQFEKQAQQTRTRVLIELRRQTRHVEVRPDRRRASPKHARLTGKTVEPKSARRSQ
jgi:CubicO group peptidase (beta-lactamase class C family)